MYNCIRPKAMPLSANHEEQASHGSKQEETSMVRKTVGYIQLEWQCPNCQSRNPGPAKFCNGCGAPQPQDVEFEQPVESELITDAAEIAKAKAGPDVHCPYCEGRNPGTAKFCGSCGGDLSEAAVRKHGKELGVRKMDAKPIVCPACGTENKATAKRCVQCGSRLAKPKEEAKPKAAERPRGSPILLIVLGVIGCAAIGVFLYLLLSTSDVSAEVTSLSWERSIGIEALLPATHEDWYEDIPVDAPVGSCTQQLYETLDSYVSGSVEVCGDEIVEDTGTGLGEVVQVCVYEVYEDWCEYTVDEWQEVTRATATGVDLILYWPDAVLESGQRRGSERESYQVTFTSSKGQHDYEPETATEFMLYELGSQWTLELNKLGGLMSVKAE
jgi:DNA-directed RNA polymerase subunit RPC12/RpoP